MRPFPAGLRLLFILLLCAACCASGCAPTHSLPQPHLVTEPAATPGAVRTARWDIAALGYQYLGQGLDYQSAGLAPVFLVFKNHSQEQPQVLVEEVRGLGRGEYLPYSIEEACRLVYASNVFEVAAGDAARNGAIGAAVGAGLGALIGLLTGGNDAIWQGALIGGAIGGVGGAVTSIPEAKAQLREATRQELYYYAWREEPLPPQYTRFGYIYLPGNVGIERIRLTVRSAGKVETFEVPIARPAPGAAQR